MNTLFKTEDENVKTFFEKTGLDINEVTSKCRKEHLVYERITDVECDFSKYYCWYRIKKIN